MNLPTESSSIKEIHAVSQKKEAEIVSEYKNLNEKCDAVLDKINKRKKTGKKSKK